VQTINEFSRVSGRTMVLVLFFATLLAVCPTITVDCGGKAYAQAGCASTNLAVGSALPGGAIVINPTGGTIPPGAACGAVSTQCNAPGSPCGLAKQKCRDTYNIGTTQCLCQCR